VKEADSLPPIGDAEERAPITVKEKEVRAKEEPKKEPRRGPL